MGTLLSHNFLSGDLISPENKASCQKCSFSIFKLKFLITGSKETDRDLGLFCLFTLEYLTLALQYYNCQV